jgi:hypothetical protein
LRRTLKAKSQKLLMLIGMIAFVALIGLSALSCEQDSGGGDNNGGNTNYSLDGFWGVPDGTVFRISGSNGYYEQFGSNITPLWQNAIDKGIVSIGAHKFRYITKTGDRTWSGQAIGIYYYNNNPNVAYEGEWGNVTFNMSADGQTFQEYWSEGVTNYTRIR